MQTRYGKGKTCYRLTVEFIMEPKPPYAATALHKDFYVDPSCGMREMGNGEGRAINSETQKYGSKLNPLFQDFLNVVYVRIK